MEKTNYPSIDKPWLQFYDVDAYSKALNTPKDKSIWDVYKPILENYGDVPVLRYYNHDFSNEEYQLRHAVVFSRGNIETIGKITYLPLYMIIFFKKETMVNKIRFSDM